MRSWLLPPPAAECATFVFCFLPKKKQIFRRRLAWKKKRVGLEA
jgi:hypothetical protein